MKLRQPLKRIAIAIAGIFAAYLLLGWLALPRILQSQAEKYILEKSGHHLVMDRPEFNPFTLNLHLSRLRLTEPDGKPLFAFRDLNVNFSIASLYRHTLQLDAIELDDPTADVMLLRDGRLNWSALIAALGNKAQPSQSALPRMAIQKFVLNHGHVNFKDARATFSTRIEPVELELNNLSTLPDNQGNYRIQASTSAGARISWQGKIMLNPLAVTGDFKVANFMLAQLQPYLKGIGKPPAGVAELSARYQLKQSGKRAELTLDDLAFKLKGLQIDIGKDAPDFEIGSIAEKNGHYDLIRNRLTSDSFVLTDSTANAPRPGGGGPLKLLKLRSLTAEKLQIDIANRNVRLGRVAMQTGEIKAVRNTLGEIDLLGAVQGILHPATDQPGKTKTAPHVTPWHYQVGKLEINRISADLHDERVKPAADLGLQDITVNVTGISDDLSKPLPVRMTLNARSGGDLEVVGNITPGEMAADLQVKLSGLALQPAQPYLASIAKLRLKSGQLSTQGHLNYDKHGAHYQGGLSLTDLRLIEDDTHDTFLAWTSVDTQKLEMTSGKLDIGTLNITGLESKLIVHKDRSMNLTRILKSSETPATPPASQTAAGQIPAGSSATVTDKAGKSPVFLTRIERIKIKNGAMFYADYSLVLPFATRIRELHGYITDISPDKTGQIELDGQVDDYGLAHAAGQIKLFDPTAFTDIKVLFSNVEMNRLTPYSGTFAGRKIDSGKLTLDLEYKIDKRQLTGNNKIVMDKLVLGDKVASPDATNLPLDMAIAVLQDSDGVIDLGLPVSGSLNDPKFGLGSIVWQAIKTVISRIASAPFRMLGALFGNNDEKFGHIEFAAGKAHLTPPEREKLVHLADVLNKRPNLLLTVQGVYADADRVALQDRQLRSSLVRRMGLHTSPNEDPGPVSTDDPKAQAALENLYAKSKGRGELAAMKAGFRIANPGQMEERTGGKILSRLSGVFSDRRTLSEQEMAQLKGADFYAVLFQQLRDNQAIEEAQLQALAQLRGNYVMDTLKSADAPPERISLASATKVTAQNNEVPIKIELGAAPKAAAAQNLPAAAAH